MPQRLDADGRTALRGAARSHERPSLAQSLERLGLGRYRGYGEMLTAIDRLADRGARIATIGTPLLSLNDDWNIFLLIFSLVLRFAQAGCIVCFSDLL